MISKAQLEKFLMEEISTVSLKTLRENTQELSNLISLLWQITLENMHPLAWRAAWSMYHLGHQQKVVFRPILNEMIIQLPSFKHDGQKRECMKILLLFDIQSLDMGKLLQISYDFLLNPQQALAVRVHAMQIIYEISEIEPELKAELKSSLLFLLPNTSAGFKSRANKLLHKMKKIDL